MKNQLLFTLIITFLATIAPFAQTTVFKVDTLYTGVTSINIDGAFSRIDVNAGNSESVNLNARLEAEKENSAYRIVHQVENGVLSIRIQFPTDSWSSHMGEVMLQIPASLSVEIQTTSGSIKANGLNNSQFKANAKSGSIEITNCNGEFTLESQTGAIKATKVTGALNTKTKSGGHWLNQITGTAQSYATDGEINMTGVKGNIRSESTTGNQTLQKIEGDVNAKIASGIIKVSTQKGNLNAISFSGPIRIFEITGQINIQSTAGEQTGGRLKLTGSSKFKTTEGKIKMQIENPTSELTFNLKSASSFIQARGNSKKKAVKLGKGPILVESESTTGGQVFN
jgi:DUF4097 and DUF4098 domain-containing protein YvlB